MPYSHASLPLLCFVLSGRTIRTGAFTTTFSLPCSTFQNHIPAEGQHHSLDHRIITKYIRNSLSELSSHRTSTSGDTALHYSSPFDLELQIPPSDGINLVPEPLRQRVLGVNDRRKKRRKTIRKKSSADLTNCIKSKQIFQEYSHAVKERTCRSININQISTLPYHPKTTQSAGKNLKTQLLTKEEEASLTLSIRALQHANQIRENLTVNKQPTEKEWAHACNVTVVQLHRLIINEREARAKLVAGNIGLVYGIAKRYSSDLKSSIETEGGLGSIISIQDMIQEGNIGLMKAAERFESSRGFRFSTYASYWVKQRILRCITDHSRVIRLPEHVHSRLRKIRKEKKQMEKDIGRAPSLPELAHRLEMSVDKLRLYTDSSRGVLSLEVPLTVSGNSNSASMEDTRTLLDKIMVSDSSNPEEDVDIESLRKEIRVVIEGLGDDRERDVLVTRFGLEDGTPSTLAETAKRLGISRERVRKVEARALNKLRQPQRNKKLKDYVGDDVDEVETMFGHAHHAHMEAIRSGGALSVLSPQEIWS